MTSSEKKLKVIGLPPDITDSYLEYIQLYFESTNRCCPDGGEVESVEIASDGSAIVTFEEQHVTERLVGKSFTIKGTVIHTERYKEIPLVFQDEDDVTVEDQHSSDECASPGVEFNWWSDIPVVAHQASNSSPEECHLSVTGAGDASNTETRKMSIPDNEIKPSSNEINKEREVIPAQNEMVQIVRDLLVGKNSESDVELPVQAKISGTDENREGAVGGLEEVKVILKPEQMKLFKKFTEDGRFPIKNYTMELDEQHQVVWFKGAGTSKAKLELYEKFIVKIIQTKVHLNRGVIKLLDTERGSKWLTELFHKNQCDVVLCFQNNIPLLLTVDEGDDVLENAKKLLDDELSHKEINFDTFHTKFLTSIAWDQVVNEYQGGKLVVIEMDSTNSVIAIGGWTTDVKFAVERVERLLKVNSLVTVPIQLKTGVWRLLQKECQTEIKTEISSKILGSTLELVFKEDSLTLVISGPKEEVDSAHELIQTNYISKVSYDSLTVSQPGLMLVTFTMIETPENEILELLEHHDNCTIVVHSPVCDVTNKCEPDVPSGQIRCDNDIQPADTVQPNNPVDTVTDPFYDISESSDYSDQEFLASSVPPISSSSTLEVKQGSLEHFKADILVNPIAKYNRNLTKVGYVSRAILKAAGSVLQEAYGKQETPRAFGTDVVVTPAGDIHGVQLVYHATIRHYRDGQSLKLLGKLISRCLAMAIKDKMTSIAFPTLGCGNLKFNEKDVAECFIKAARETTSPLKIYIVAFDQALFKSFDSLCSLTAMPPAQQYGLWNTLQELQKLQKISKALLKKQNNPVATLPNVPKQEKTAIVTTPAIPLPTIISPVVKDSPSTARDSTARDIIVFHINALSDKTVKEVKKKLSNRINKLIVRSHIKFDKIADGLTPDVSNNIMSIRNSEIDIEINGSTKTITVLGRNSDSVEAARQRVNKLLEQEEKREISLDHIKKTKGAQQYLRAFSSRENMPYPSYWTNYRKDGSMNDMGSKRTQLDPISELYKSVEMLVIKTWEPGKVGHGNDAKSLSHKGIAVRKIWCIENPRLYETYLAKKKMICYCAFNNPFPKVDGLNGEHNVVTHTLGLKKLEDHLDSEVNEFYLLHGTKDKFVDAIQNQGLDSRMTGKETLFGQGIYYAERSTKADQYADLRENRVGTGKPLHMYVVRVLLGNAYVCQVPKKFKRPPCSDPSCISDECTNHSNLYDSVIGTHKLLNANQPTVNPPVTTPSATVRLIFREFVVYHPDQSYPDFLVEYERQ